MTPGELYLPNLNKFLSSFCAVSVPLFFMVNGALILPRHLTLKQLLKKSVKLLLLFFFGKLVLQYLLCQQLFGIPHEMVHFWFLLTLAALYPICYLLDCCPLLKKSGLVLLLICPFITNFLGDISVFFFPSVELPHLAHTGLFTLYSLVYFYLGAKLKDYHISTIASLILLLVGLLLVNFELIAMSTYTKQVIDSGNALFPTIGAACMSISLFSLLQIKEFNNCYINGLLIFIGRNTIGIYMLHVLFLFWLRFFFSPSAIDLTLLFAISLSLFLMCFNAFIFWAIKKAIYKIQLSFINGSITFK